MVQENDDEPKQVRRIGDVIRQRRLRIGWNQTQLAEVSGVERSAINKLESGTTTSGRGETLARLARALGLKLDDLVSSRPSSPLPAFQPYLRAKYAELPAEAQEKLNRVFAEVRAEYGDSSDGPGEGEDEGP